MPVIRYPGSKAKLVNAITSRFPFEMQLPLWMDSAGLEYREPFFGSGAIGIEIIRRLPQRCSAWINDVDYGIASMWKSIQQLPAELCERIESFRPTSEAFYEFKAADGERCDPVLAGFRKLALHAMSYSGLGVMAGGPLGGRSQENPKYNPACRWNPEYRAAEVWDLHQLLNSRRIKITNRDFAEVVNGDRRAYYYADPPYVEKGPELYKHSFDEAAHRRLARKMLDCPAGWCLSYDDHPLIRELYAGCTIIPIDVMYTVAVESDKRRKNREILIFRGAS